MTGALRAIGFTGGDVMASFIRESLLLSLIGGCLRYAVACLFNSVETGIGSIVTFSEITCPRPSPCARVTTADLYLEFTSPEL